MVARTRVKICGVTTPAIAKHAIAAGADAVGLVFASGSPRRVDEPTANAIIDALPPFITTVGVHRNPDPERDGAVLAIGHLLQLHGDEDEALVERIGRTIIRGFAFDPTALARWDHCPHVGALLVDGPRAGTGEAFDHAALARLTPALVRPLILAGGLTPQNVGDAIRVVRPWAVDVSSGVESETGRKDPDLIHAFCRAVQDADREQAR